MIMARAQSCMLFLTWRVSAEPGGVPGPAPHPHRDPVPRDGHPDHDLPQAEPGGLAIPGVAALRDGTVQPSRAAGLSASPVSKYVEVMSKNSRSTSRSSRSAT